LSGVYYSFVRTENSNIAVLESVYAMRILAILLRDGPTFRSILYQKVSKSTNSPKARVDELLEAGLLTEDVSQFPPLSKRIGLTEKGRRVAELVAEMERILEADD